MTLTTILIRIAIAALLLTLLTEFAFKARKNWLMSYVQNFAGALFVFSGFVKAVDPLGTAYKMEQYFAEFETHFSWFAGIFPTLAEYSVAFSVLMVVLEIVLGIMLIIGASPKFSSWLFLLIVGFFTVLTGFTYLTGYVPGDATFFEFGKWGEYVKTNMKVTDCGCFGDFIKLEPKTSFLKDVFLMLPALYFIFRSKDMHQWFNGGIRSVITWLSIIGFTVYSFANFYWDIPGKDFRPFKEGVNILAQKAIEEDASVNTPVNYLLTNKSNGDTKLMSMDDYLKVFKEYPKAEWNIEQKRGEPAIPSTKISEFEVSDAMGNDVTEDLLQQQGYNFILVAYKLYYETSSETITYRDTTFALDTLLRADSMTIEKRVADIQTKEKRADKYLWDASYVDRFKTVINPLAAAAQKDGHQLSVLTSYADPAVLTAFKNEAGANYPFYTGDDILLKTIVRSNPGILLMKDGTIVKKWHYKKLPSYEEIKSTYMK